MEEHGRLQYMGSQRVGHSRSDFLIAKFRLKLKKVGKNIRLFSHDLNQISYNYTVEARNRLKGLNLMDRVPEEL